MYFTLIPILIIILLILFLSRNKSTQKETFIPSPLLTTPSKFQNLSPEITIDMISDVMNQNQPPYPMDEIIDSAIYYKGTIPIRLRDWAHNQITLVLNGLYKGTKQPWKFTSFEVMAVQKDKKNNTLVSIEFFAENPDQYSNRRFLSQFGYENNIWRLILFKPLYSNRLSQILETQLGTFGIDSNYVESPVNLLNLRYNKEFKLPGLYDTELETSPVSFKTDSLTLNTKQRELLSPPPNINQEPCRTEKFIWDNHAVQLTNPPTPGCSITNTASRNWNTYPYINPTIFTLDRTNTGLHGLFDRSINIDGSNIKAL